MEPLSFKVELRVGTLNAKMPAPGDLLIVLKDEDTMINEVSQEPSVHVEAGQDRIEINRTYQFVSSFKPLSDGGFEQRFLHLKFQLRLLDNTGQRSSAQVLKELGINRLEFSQFLSNGPLGKKHSTNLKVLKCPGNPDATVSLSIVIIEQVFQRPVTDESSYKSDNSSSIFSSADNRSSMGYQSINGRSDHSNAGIRDNSQSQMKVLAQSRSEKNFTEMKFKSTSSNNLRAAAKQPHQVQMGASPDDLSPQQTNTLNVQRVTQPVVKVLKKAPTKQSQRDQEIMNSGEKSTSGSQNNRIDNLIKSLSQDDELIRQQQGQIMHLQREIESLQIENHQLRQVNQQQTQVISHLQRKMISEQNQDQYENQQLKKQMVDIQSKYQHLLQLYRDQSQAHQRQAPKKGFVSSHNGSEVKHCQNSKKQQQPVKDTLGEDDEAAGYGMLHTMDEHDIEAAQNEPTEEKRALQYFDIQRRIQILIICYC